MNPFMANQSYCCIDIDQLWKRPVLLRKLILNALQHYVNSSQVGPHLLLDAVVCGVIPHHPEKSVGANIKRIKQLKNITQWILDVVELFDLLNVSINTFL